mmetsp:Transcript_10765/g.26132  ORF Transcript_10765/g.26132 Transcript_10765/m.26132 type:complete len:88 (-) Transcript_10765:299-562(-)
MSRDLLTLIANLISLTLRLAATPVSTARMSVAAHLKYSLYSLSLFNGASIACFNRLLARNALDARWMGRRRQDRRYHLKKKSILKRI